MSGLFKHARVICSCLYSTTGIQTRVRCFLASAVPPPAARLLIGDFSLLNFDHRSVILITSMFTIVRSHWHEREHLRKSLNLRPQTDDSTVRTSLIHLRNGVGMPVCYSAINFINLLELQSGKQISWFLFENKLTSQSVWSLLISLISAHFLRGVAHCSCPGRSAQRGCQSAHKNIAAS